LGRFRELSIEPYLIMALFIGLVPISWVLNRPKALRRTDLTKLLSEIIGKDVNSILVSTTPPQMFSSNKVPPMLNARPTVEEKKMVQCIKPSSHCQNCGHCVKTAIVHRTQWIYCNNPNRITTNGSNSHYWHTPELALPCHSGDQRYS
jgi:hypothetical protein